MKETLQGNPSVSNDKHEQTIFCAGTPLYIGSHPRVGDDVDLGSDVGQPLRLPLRTLAAQFAVDVPARLLSPDKSDF